MSEDSQRLSSVLKYASRLEAVNTRLFDSFSTDFVEAHSRATGKIRLLLIVIEHLKSWFLAYLILPSTVLKVTALIKRQYVFSFAIHRPIFLIVASVLPLVRRMKF